MTAILLAAAVLAASVALNAWLVRRQKAMTVELAETRTELARVVLLLQAQREHNARKAEIADEVAEKTAARLEHDPSAAQVRQTIAQITRRRR